MLKIIVHIAIGLALGYAFIQLPRVMFGGTPKHLDNSVFDSLFEENPYIHR